MIEREKKCKDNISIENLHTWLIIFFLGFTFSDLNRCLKFLKIIIAECLNKLCRTKDNNILEF